MPANARASEATIAASARALSAFYWELADELRSAAVGLSTTIDASGHIPVVGTGRLAEAIERGLILRALASDRRPG